MSIVLFASPGILGPFILATLIQMKERIAYLVVASSHHAVPPQELLEIAAQGSVPVLTPERLDDEGFLKKLKAAAPELILVATFDRKIPDAVIRIPSRGALNIHSAALPRYRGACPEFWVLRNGESKTGVTIHTLTGEFDAGDIIARDDVPINESDTVGMLAYRIATVAARLLITLLLKYRQGEMLIPIPQDERLVTYAPLVTADHLRIRWEEPARSLYNLVRAANPVGGAWTSFRGYHMKVWYAVPGPAVHADVAQSQENEKKAPGTVLLDPVRKTVSVQTGAGLLELKVVQPALYYIIDAWSFTELAMVRQGEIVG